MNRIDAIAQVPGVAGFVLVNEKGCIATQQIDDPKGASETVFSCGRIYSTLARSGFTYTVFQRGSGQDFFIFPVGNHYLGVIKERNHETFSLAKDILKFLADILPHDH